MKQRYGSTSGTKGKKPLHHQPPNALNFFFLNGTRKNNLLPMNSNSSGSVNKELWGRGLQSEGFFCAWIISHLHELMSGEYYFMQK